MQTLFLKQIFSLSSTFLRYRLKPSVSLDFNVSSIIFTNLHLSLHITAQELLLTSLFNHQC